MSLNKGPWAAGWALGLLVLTFQPVRGAGTSTSSGGSVAHVLSAPPDARSAAMGGAALALLDSHSQSYINPAALGTLYDRDIQTAYALVGGRAHFFNTNGLWARPQSGNVGAGLTHVEYNDPPSGNALAQAVGRDAQSASVAILTYGTPPDYNTFFSNIPLGVSFKFIRQSFTNSSGTGFGADIGAGFVVPGVAGLTLGASLVNVGYVSGLSAGKGDLPLTWGVGLAYKLSLDDVFFEPLFGSRILQNPGEDLRLATDTVRTTGGNIRLLSGAELWIAETVALRGGVQVEFVNSGQGNTATATTGTNNGLILPPVPTMGLGLGVGEPYNIRLDLSYLPGGLLGDDLRFTLVYVFDRFANSPEQIRLRRLRKKRQEAQLEEEDRLEDEELFKDTEED